jgi:geranylgeranylglycerol-phosphate geranylgeranyltransferase
MVTDPMKKYWAFARPFTLVPPLLGIISGAVCAFGSAHNPDPQRQVTLSLVLTVALGSLCASFLNAASNIINQIYDLEIDRKNKPQRPLITGLISIKAAWIFGIALYVAAIVPTYIVVPYPHTSVIQKLTAPFFTRQAFIIYILGMIFTFVYSAPAMGRTKRLGIWANVTIAIPRGILLKVAGWTFVASASALEAWYIGGIFGLFLLGSASTKDFSDMEGDALGGCRTLPIIYGVKKACWIISPSFILPWLLIPLGVLLRDPHDPTHPILTGNPYLLVALGLILAMWGIYTVYLIVKDPDSLAATENHPSWTHMYLMMMSAQVGFALAYIL